MTNEELLEVIEKAARDRSTHLDLSLKNLTSIPAQIAQLTNLIKLDLRFNKLKNLPVEIRKLTNLIKLDLSHNEFLSLPIEVTQISNLEQLYINGNQLINLPEEIVQLTNLRELSINNNRLVGLPAEIVQLTKLRKLCINGNQLNSLYSEIAQLTNLRELSISNNRLVGLPADIIQLTKLRKLDINGNRLTSLPVEIVQFTNLRKLDLSYNLLKNLPKVIRQLNKLQELRVNSNQLSNLPVEIGYLVNLSIIDCSYNQLSDLPAEIGQLINLNIADFSYNQLSWLPKEIGQLVGLNKLNLENNQLKIIPNEISQLINLNKFHINNNQIRNLPTETIQLKNLKEFYINSNQIENLPIKIGQLTNLREFYANSNQLKNLPEDITQLTNLKKLDLSYNRLTNLPVGMGQLTKLRRLDLRDNQLVKLPPELGLLHLAALTFGNNPWQALPPEIRSGGVRAILNFCRQQLEGETDQIYEAKLLIIGEGGAGKTTLAKKIQSSDYQLKEEDSTQGIDVMQWKFLLDNGKEFRVNIWDFGGQEIYHTTHQFFLTKRSLYALVVDTRKEDTDFHYWLSVVELLSDNSPLLIVKNEKQERQREINERQLRGEFTNLKETLPTNFATQRGLPEILKQIKHHISNLPHVGTELPKTWVKVREALERESRHHISLDEYLNLCEQNGFTRREDKLQLSGYLHDLGVCLHFQEDDVLMKMVILKPTWGTDAVYKVLDNPLVINNQGRFTRDDLKQIWHEDKYAAMQPELLRLMMNFKLCYEIPNAPKTYIAPQLLTANQPEYPWDESDNLLLRYEYEFMPKGILTRFIVEMHAWIESQSCVWKSGVVLSKNSARAEIMELYRYHKGEIRIKVSGKRQRDLLTIIRHEFDKIHDSYNSQNDRLNKAQRLKYVTLVPCNCSTCKPSQNRHFYKLDTLYNFQDKNREEIPCEISGDMVRVHNLINDIDLVKLQYIDAKKRRSNKQQESFQKEWDLEHERLTSLRLNLVSETEVARRFQLENQIKEAETRMKELDDRLN
jgi:internalin A